MRKARVTPFVQTKPDEKTEDLKVYCKGKDLVEIEVPLQKNIVKPLNMLNDQPERATHELIVHAKNWNILINTVRFKTNLVSFQNLNREPKKEKLATTENARCGVQYLCLLDEYNALNVKNKVQQNKDSMDKENKNETLIKYFINLARKDNDQEKLVDFQHLSDMFQSGVNINTTDKHGQSVMHEVARIWHIDVAKFLLLHGANVNQSDNFGRTPLHVASAVNFPEMVSFLLENKADINSRTYGEEQTPIHYAAKNDAVDSLNVLLQLGANIEDKDYKQRTPLQIAAELDRSATARVLIENGADASVYDDSNTAVMVLLMQNMPIVAQLALNQFHNIDRATRREHFYLNCLSPPIEDETCFAKSPLEVTVERNQYSLLLHPVIKELIKMKWRKIARLSAVKDITVNFLLCVLWTTLICTKKGVSEKMYAGSQIFWRPIFEGIAVITLIINIIIEIIDFFKSQQKTKNYKQWREDEIRKDFQYCHARWPDEQAYLEREIQELKNSKSYYVKDYWNIFDWTTYSLMGMMVVSHLADYRHQSPFTKETVKAVASAMMVCMWLRLLKYARPFKALGFFVVMTGHVVRDTLKILFLAGHIFIPYIAAFWINFGVTGTEGYTMDSLELFFNIFQMALIGDYKFDNIAQKDKVMAEILCATYIFLGGLVCLNLFIALMSNTFQRVYDNAKVNALMQQAACIVNKETKMTYKNQLQHREWINENCAPQISYYDDNFDSENIEFMKKTEEINQKLDKLNNSIESKSNVKSLQVQNEDNNSSEFSELNEINTLLKMITEFKQEYHKSTIQTRAEIAGLGLMLKDLIEANESNEQKSQKKKVKYTELRKKHKKSSRQTEHSNHALKAFEHKNYESSDEKKHETTDSKSNTRQIKDINKNENIDNNNKTSNEKQDENCVNEKLVTKGKHETSHHFAEDQKHISKFEHSQFNFSEIQHSPFEPLQTNHQYYDNHLQDQQPQHHAEEVTTSHEFFEGYTFQGTEPKQHASFIQAKWNKIFSHIISTNNQDSLALLEDQKTHSVRILPRVKIEESLQEEDET